jgi:uncharacterized repeat protein (TIGR03803 family)
MRRFSIFISLSILLSLTVVLKQSSEAQAFTVLHTFTGGEDGGVPYSGVTMDAGGNLYGTAASDGDRGRGVVFKLTDKSGGWIFTPLYSFAQHNDGAEPWAGVIIGSDGTLYGTTQFGGKYGWGTVFKIRPSAHASPNTFAPWTETLLFQFLGGLDGRTPATGDLVSDQSGNLFGTTSQGGYPLGGCFGYGCGIVYELTPSSHGVWTENVLYSFTGGSDGGNLWSGVVFDNAGNLYGTAQNFGTYYGTVYQLSPKGSAWRENTLYIFQGGADGSNPIGGLILDGQGNLYGTTIYGGEFGCGTVFKLSPSDGGWTETVIYAFSCSGNGYGPWSGLVMDATGSLYGTTNDDGAYGLGSVFKLTPSSGGVWTYVDLHDFNGGDGANPLGGVTLDAKGNLYGTTSAGGAYGLGVVWEITP